MKYEIMQGAISAVITVIREDGRIFDCYYISEKRPVQEGVGGSEDRAEARFEALPLEVRAAVNRQFGEVFSLPVERRGAWVKAQVPFEVEVQENLA